MSSYPISFRILSSWLIFLFTRTPNSYLFKMSKKTSVLYYIPEDGDEADHPNVMMVDKNASQVTLKDIKEVRSVKYQSNK